MLRIRKIKRAITRRRNLKNFALSILALLIFLTIIETGCFFTILIKSKTYPKEEIYTETSSKYIKEDEDLGYKGIPNATSHEIKYYNMDNIIFEANYSLDEYGRRKTEDKPGKPHLILFGGSFTFGYGLSDDKTLSYFLSELTDYSIYNYGIEGYGPNQMLAQLQQEGFEEEVPEKEGIAIYVFIDHHIRRAIGDMEVINQDVPYYYLDKENKIQRKRSFGTGRPIISSVYRILSESSFFKLFGINLPPKSSKHIYLTSRIIEEASHVYNSKFNGTFYFMAHPESTDSEDTKQLIEMLRESDVSVLDVKVVFFENKHSILGDGHPTALLNYELAQAIANDLNINQK